MTEVSADAVKKFWFNTMPVTLADSELGPFSTAGLAGAKVLTGVSPDYAMTEGGAIVSAITKAALTHVVAAEGHELAVDVRVEHLAKGRLPPVQNWHGDNIPRSMVTGQSDPRLIDRSVKHRFVIFSDRLGGVSSTEFVAESVEVPLDLTAPIWGQIAASIDSCPSLERRIVPDGRFCIFDSSSIHRASPAHESGTRLFFRMVNKRRALPNGWVLD